MHHALSGMPQCRHCTKKFTTWHAFFYHINARGCQDLRDFFASDGPKDKAAPASDALVDSPEILELTQHCTWRDVALHPRTRSSLHHCPECYQWAVKPSYVRRHMLARHKEQLPIIERSQELINRSVLGLQNPCQFCGTAYQRKSAHLKACAGIFNGPVRRCQTVPGPVVVVAPPWPSPCCRAKVWPVPCLSSLRSRSSLPLPTLRITYTPLKIPAQALR